MDFSSFSHEQYRNHRQRIKTSATISTGMAGVDSGADGFFFVLTLDGVWICFLSGWTRLKRVLKFHQVGHRFPHVRLWVRPFQLLSTERALSAGVATRAFMRVAKFEIFANLSFFSNFNLNFTMFISNNVKVSINHEDVCNDDTNFRHLIGFI